MSSNFFFLVPFHELLIVSVVDWGRILKCDTVFGANVILVHLRLQLEPLSLSWLLEIKELWLVNHWIRSAHSLANPKLIVCQVLT